MNKLGIEDVSKQYFQLNVRLKKLLEKYTNLVNAVNFLKEEIEDLSQTINELGVKIQELQKEREIKVTKKKQEVKRSG
ncbi:hypothetical protein DRN75_02305 [Nanoarchaeota archaeon]|nr:MAG: hypothetical protein DRN75_02305 [Nanoarchaeota archaeon]